MSGGEPRRTVGAVTAAGLVVASMVGGGVFITTGGLLERVPSGPGVLLAWIVGGLAALSGALSYAELGVALASNGGEYHYLSRLYHPALGFVSAWVSLVVGFAAPASAIAVVFGYYVREFVPAFAPKPVAAVTLLVLSAMSAWRVSASARFQNAMTYAKVLLVLGLAILALRYGDTSRLLHSTEALAPIVTSGRFAAGLLLVSFAYTGWNASSYIAGEVDRPDVVLPRALVGGTLAVTLLYLLLNAGLLAAAPMDTLRGQFEVARLAFIHLLGPRGGGLVAGIIAAGFVSTIGAMIVTGPRVYEAVGRDYPRLSWLAMRRDGGGPLAATALQCGISLLLLAFDPTKLIEYIEFTLSITAALAVGGVFVLRRRGLTGSFRTPGYPVTPLVFIAIMLVTAVSLVMQRPLSVALGLCTVLAGLAVWWLVRPRADRLEPRASSSPR
jgi:APA family basic amino acid/polyamine antiporter